MNFSYPGAIPQKIAIPTRDNSVDNHFGHCAEYTVYTVTGKSVVAKETVESPQGCGCKSNIAAELRSIGVGTMLAGNIGEGAITKLSQAGIQVIRGCSGNTDELINAYLEGQLSDNGQTCDAHAHGHTCSNH